MGARWDCVPQLIRHTTREGWSGEETNLTVAFLRCFLAISPVGLHGDVAISEELQAGEAHAAEGAVADGDDSGSTPLGPHHERQDILPGRRPAEDVATQCVKESGAGAAVAVVPRLWLRSRLAAHVYPRPMRMSRPRR
jgi:hypothetical protein